MPRASGLVPAGKLKKRKKKGAGMRPGGRIRKAAGMKPAGRVKKAAGMKPAGRVRKRRKKKAGGYVPGKLLTKLTIGRMIKALRAHWKK